MGSPWSNGRSQSTSLVWGGSPLMTTQDLWNAALPKFVLEFRDETSWVILPQAERWASVDKGWNRLTPQELAEILESEGAIKTESINKHLGEE